jgi:hypothetical protein
MAGKGVRGGERDPVESSETLLQVRGGDAARAPRADARGSASRQGIRISDGRPRDDGETLLGRYRLLERLGAGGFGVVWRAHDESLDREVALKRILLPSEEDRGRAIREAHATARLSHPAIVALYEACTDEDAFYLISELVEGDTLARLIADDDLQDEEIFEIGIALCEALEHAHARGVVHRDVKPQNVLVPSDVVEPTPRRGSTPAAAKLADFGGARLAGEDALTRTGDVLGTLAYMAPEQSEGHEVGPPADLYSLALVLYEALCGANPVRGRTPAATARRIGTPIERLERRRRDLPRELTRALDVALDPDPLRRGNLAALHEALHDALEKGSRGRLLPRRSGSTRAETEMTPPPRSHERTLLALPRMLWFGCALAAALWQAAAGRSGAALLVLAAAVPLLALPRRSDPGWLLGAGAPLLGLIGLAGAFPALAAQRAGWRARAGLAALSFWWLTLAEPLLARRLWLGPPSGVPPRSVWESSLSSAATHVIAALLTVELVLGAAVWALAAVVLPWLVRGHHAILDVVAAVLWTMALLALMPLLDRALLPHAAAYAPRGFVLGAVLGCAVAIGARALRGPVRGSAETP